MSTAANNDDRNGAPLFNTWRRAGRPTFSPRPEAGVVGLRNVFAPVRRHLRIIAATILGGTVAATIVAFTLPEIYTASASLVLEHTDTPVIDPAGEFSRYGPNRAGSVSVVIETEMDKIKSRDFAGLVVDALDLVEDRNFNIYLPLAETPQGAATLPGRRESLAQKVAEKVEVTFTKILASLPAKIRTQLSDFGLGVSPSDGPLPAPSAQRERTVSTFLSKLSVTRSGQSLAISIHLSHGDPKQAAAVVNDVADMYVRRSLEIRKNSTDRAIKFLQERAVQLVARVAESERKISDHRRDNQLDLDRRDEVLRAEKAQIIGRLLLAKAESAEAENRLAQFQASPDGRPAATDTGPISPLMATLHHDEKRLLIQRAGFTSVLSRGDSMNANSAENAVSNLQSANIELSNVRKKIAGEFQRMARKVEKKALAAAARVKQIEAELAATDDILEGRSLAEIMLRRFERELETDSRRYDQVVERLGILDLKAESLQPSARVVSMAEVPTERSFPKRKAIIAGGFIGSAMLSIILTLMAEGLDARIRTEQQTMRVSQLPNLAYVPELPRKRWQRSAQPFKDIKERPLSLFAESIRTIYIACRRSNIQNPPQVIMMTSCLPSEGKTSLAYSLAVTAAGSGQKTVLVDLDLHRRGVSTMPGIERQEVSLDNYFVGECALSDVIQADPDTPGLDIIAVTGQVEKLTWSLNSHHLAPLLEALRAQYDVVIADTPPVLIVNDANWLSPLIDAAILVVRWGQTTEDTLRDTVRLLQINRVPVIGTIINRVDPRMQARHGYGGALTYHKYAGSYYSN